MNKGEQAIAYHHQGYNCAQAILIAFAPEMDMSVEQAAILGQALGAGVGMREVCGVLTGSAIVLSVLRGTGRVPTPTEKALLYTRTRELGERFEAVHGSIRCVDLLSLDTRYDPVPAQRPCNQLIYDMAMLLEEDLDADS